MILQSNVLTATQQFVETLFAQHLPKQYIFHTLKHTCDVVEAVQEIGTKSQLTEAELEVCLLAAWLHDCGYCFSYEGHEEESIRLSRQFLLEQGLVPEKIDRVMGCIAATKFPQRPQTLLEAVVCDADMFHMSSDLYLEKAEQLRQELHMAKKCSFSKQQWMQINEEFLKKHHYFTQYGQECLAERKAGNLIKVKAIINTMEQQSEDITVPLPDASLPPSLPAEEHPKKNKEKQKSKAPNRGVETMFRTMSASQLELSSIADNKANIMISINSIVLSIIVTVLARKLDEYPHFTIPTLILTLVCLCTIVFAVLATRPNVTTGIFTREDVYKKRTNLLFFGNFHRMKLDDYEWGMREMMQDRDYLYGSMIRDNYFLGQVLGKKYKLLRIAYTIFMYGIVVAILAYVVAIAMYPNAGK